MAKPTMIDKAIASLEGEIAVLHSAIAKLREQQKTQKKPKAVKPRLADAS